MVPHTVTRRAAHTRHATAAQPTPHTRPWPSPRGASAIMSRRASRVGTPRRPLPRGDSRHTAVAPRSAECGRVRPRTGRGETARSGAPTPQDRQHNQYNFSSRSTENAQSLICSLTCRISLHISLTASPTTPHVVRGARPRTRRTHSLDRSHRPLLARRGGLGAPPQAPGSVAYHILVRWPARG